MVRGTFAPDAARGARWPARLGGTVIGIALQAERLLGIGIDEIAAVYARSGATTPRYDARPPTVSGSSDDAGIDTHFPEHCAGDDEDAATSQHGSSVRQLDDSPLPQVLGDVGEANEADALELEGAQDGASSSSSSSCDLNDAEPGRSEREGLQVSDDDEEAALSVVAQLAMEDSSYKNRSKSERANVTMVYRHVNRRTIHYGNLDDFDRLACSRALNSNYVQELRDPFKLWPLCRDCFP